LREQRLKADFSKMNQDEKECLMSKEAKERKELFG